MALKIKGLNIKNLQNHEHYGFVTEIKLILDAANIESLATLLGRFSALVEEENKSLELIVKSEHTQQLASLDKATDQLYRGLSAAVNAASYSPVKEENEAGTLLRILIKTYGRVTSESYESQHSKIENLLQDMRSDKYKGAVKKIAVGKWLDWIEDADRKFMELYRTRRDEKATVKKDFRSVKAVRADIDGVYREVIEHLNAIAVLQPSEEISKIVSRINVLIEKLTALKASRKTRKNNTKNKKSDSGDKGENTEKQDAPQDKKDAPQTEPTHPQGEGEPKA